MQVGLVAKVPNTKDKLYLYQFEVTFQVSIIADVRRTTATSVLRSNPRQSLPFYSSLSPFHRLGVTHKRDSFIKIDTDCHTNCHTDCHTNINRSFPTQCSTSSSLFPTNRSPSAPSLFLTPQDAKPLSAAYHFKLKSLKISRKL